MNSVSPSIAWSSSSHAFFVLVSVLASFGRLGLVHSIEDIAPEGTCPAGSASCGSTCDFSDVLSDTADFVRRDQEKGLLGMHAVCIWRAEEGGARGYAYLNSLVSSSPLELSVPSLSITDLKALRKFLAKSLGVKKDPGNWGSLHLRQGFGLFDLLGRRLKSLEDVLAAHQLILVEGGQWIWPPVREGFKRMVGRELELETLSLQPIIFTVRGFLAQGECSELIRIGSTRMAPSPVTLMDHDKGKAATEFRTSSQARVPSRDFQVLADIDERVAFLTKVPTRFQEEVQILRYNFTQYYTAHLDAFDPQYYTGQDTSWMENGHMNRLSTLIWYMSDVAEGGETHFPRTFGLPQPHDSCGKGLKVKPELGKILMWYNLLPNGNIDNNALHAACPVGGSDLKWAANKWVWNKPREPR